MTRQDKPGDRRWEILILTHGGPGIGGGHLSRCRALAEALAEEGCSLAWCVNQAGACTLSAGPAGKGERYILEDPFSPEQLPDVRDLARKADLVIVDSYSPDLHYLKQLKAEAPLMVIDDFGDRPVEEPCDLLLNYNLNAGEIPYEEMPGQPRLLGPRWVLLRPEVGQALPVKGHYVFFVAGATDLLGVTEDLVRFWEPDWPALKAVLGPMVPGDLVKRCRELAKAKSNVELLHAPGDFLDRMAAAGKVICTSSVTAYEALALKKDLAVFQVADNQVGIGRAIQGQGYGNDLGWWGNSMKDRIAAFLKTPPAVPADAVNPGGAKETARYLIRMLEERGTA